MQPPQIVAATFRCISPTDKFYSPIPAASSIRSSSFAATLSGWPLRLTMQTARGGDDPRRGMVADAQIHARMAHGTLAETGNATRNSSSTSGSRRSPIPCSVHPQVRRSSTPRHAGPSSPPAAKSAAPPSSERNPSPSFCTSNTNTASADRATARQSSRIARKGQGGGDGVMPFSGALQRGGRPFPGPATGGSRDESGLPRPFRTGLLGAPDNVTPATCPEWP